MDIGAGQAGAVFDLLFWFSFFLLEKGSSRFKKDLMLHNAMHDAASLEQKAEWHTVAVSRSQNVQFISSSYF